MTIHLLCQVVCFVSVSVANDHENVFICQKSLSKSWGWSFDTGILNSDTKKKVTTQVCKRVHNLGMADLLTKNDMVSRDTYFSATPGSAPQESAVHPYSYVSDGTAITAEVFQPAPC